MGADKHSSKGGAAHGGGWLQLFDWNAKSRKKLFSSKPNSSELSKQKQRCDGNMPVTLQHLVAEDDILTGSSMRGSSDYSCASSLTDEEIGVPRPPSVVARLMGLDSFTMPSVRDVYSSSNFDTQSLQDSRLHSRYQGSHTLFHSGNLHHKMDDPVRNAMEQKYQKISNRPIEKFQAEILPPKSAKSIPITHQKLLSPMKNANFVSSENAAHIMEVAARVIGPGPQVTAKPKLSAVGSSSVPLRVRDLKEKVQAAQKQTKLAEASHLPHESNAFKHPNGASRDKNRNGSADANSEAGSSNSEASRLNKKGKSKSISLALQAKANIQKRERLYSSGSRSQVDQKELNEGLSSESFKHEPSVQKCTNKRPSSLGSSRVLQQNNQKQNCSADKGKMISKHSLPNPKSQGRKPVNRDSSVARYKSASKSDGNSRVVSRRSRSEAMEGNSEDSYSTSRNISRKKRSVDANIPAENTVDGEETWINGNEKLVQSGPSREERNLMIEEGKRNGADVISFTFSAPMTRRSVHEHETFREAQKKKFGFDADFQSKRSSHSIDDTNNKFSSSQCNVIGSDALSSLLDRTLKELNRGLDASLTNPTNGNTSPSTFQDSLDDGLPTMASFQDCETQDSRQTDEFGTDLSSTFSSTDLQRILMKHKIQGLDLEINNYPRKYNESADMVDYRLPSPFSVLENSLFTESCNSSDTADSFTTRGSKQSSSVQAQENLGACPSDADAELNDSASSISAQTSSMKVCTSSSSDSCMLRNRELGYVKEILSDIDMKFMNFSLGRTEKIIGTHNFNQLKNQNRFVEKNIPSPRQKVLFDCVAECIDNRCMPHTGGGCKAWMEGMNMVKRKERLAEDIYKEISGWSGMGDSMVDELVDKDMSNKYGRWLDFETEASELGKHVENRILNMLLDEVIADIL